MPPTKNNDLLIAQVCNRVLVDLKKIGEIADTLSAFHLWEDQLERLYDTKQLVESATALVLEIKSKV